MAFGKRLKGARPAELLEKIKETTRIRSAVFSG